MGYRIQNRRDTAARWAEMNPILLEGEMGIVLDDPNQYKIGDGVHTWNELPLRGFTGTIAQTLGNNENAVASQKVVTEKFTEQDKKLSDIGSEVDLKTFMLFGGNGHESENYTWENPTNSYEILNGLYYVDGTFVETDVWENIKMNVSYGQLFKFTFDYVNFSPNVSVLSFLQGSKVISVLNANIYTTYKNSIIISIPQDVDSIVYFKGNTLVQIGRSKLPNEFEWNSKLEFEKLELNFTRFVSDNSFELRNRTWISPSRDIVERVEGLYQDNGDFVASDYHTDLVNVNEGDLVRLDIKYANYTEGVAVVTLWKDDALVNVPLPAKLYPNYTGSIVGTIPKGVNKIGVMVSAVTITLASYESSNVGHLVESLQIESGNLVLGSTIFESLGIDNTGTIIELTQKPGWSMSVINVKPNTAYYIKAKSYRLDSVGALGYSENNQINVGITKPFVDMSTLEDYEGFKVFRTDSNTNYIFINLKPLLSDNEVIIKDNLSKKDFPTTIGERMLFEHIESGGEKQHFFKDKKIALFGDSITWQAIGSNPKTGWATYFNEILQFGELVNYSRSGATWSNTASTTYNITENTGSLSNDNVIYNQFNRLLNDISNGAKAPDYIIVAAGTNDAWYPQHRPNALSKTAKEVFEDESTNYLESVDINQCTSIAQAFRYVAEMIIANLPTTKVVICTPLQSTAFTAERNNGVTEVISSCANYMSWNVIVQSKECGVSRLEEKRGYKNTYDGTHTSETGAKAIGTYLANKFSSMFRENL